MPSSDVVIEACLQAACIRAAATLFCGDSPFSISAADTVDSIARGLYADATRDPWKRGDAK